MNFDRAVKMFVFSTAAIAAVGFYYMKKLAPTAEDVIVNALQRDREEQAEAETMRRLAYFYRGAAPVADTLHARKRDIQNRLPLEERMSHIVGGTEVNSAVVPKVIDVEQSFFEGTSAMYD